MYYYKGTIAGVEINYAFRHKDTAKYYGDMIEPGSPQEDPVMIPEKDFRLWEDRWGYADEAPTEYGLSIYHTCDRLLENDRCVFHAVSILWREKAYLITAASGTGKSTQLKNWIHLYGDETVVMNGDKPILHKDRDGKIRVLPSPWKGKERWGDDSVSAELGGIIFLKQGNENSIRRLDHYESVPLLLPRFLFTVSKKENVLAAASIEEVMIHTVPVWLLTNLGDMDSTRLIHQAVTDHLLDPGTRQ